MNPLTLQDYIDILVRRCWWLIVPVVLSLSAAATLIYTLPKSYLASTLILVEPQKVPDDYVQTTVTGTIEDRLTTIQQQILSRSLLLQVIDEYQIYQEDSGRKTSEEMVKAMRKNITVETVRGRTGGAFAISYVGSDPTTTMKVTNRLATLFIDQNLKLREQSVTDTTDFLDSELQRLKGQLEAQELSISQYKQRYIGALPGQMEANLRTLDRLQLQLQTVTSSIRELSDQKQMLQQVYASADSKTLATLPNALRGDPRVGQLQALRQKLATLEAEYTDDYPDILITRQQITRFEADLAVGLPPDSTPTVETTPSTAVPSGTVPDPTVLTLDQQMARLQEQRQALLSQIELYERRVEEAPKREQELAVLMRDYDNTAKSYNILLAKAGNAKISENLEKRQKSEQFRILDPANLPEAPYKPKPFKILLLGFAIGLGLGAALAFTLEQMDTSIKKSDDLEQQFGFPVIGVIPKADTLRKSVIQNGSSHSPLQPTAQGGREL